MSTLTVPISGPLGKQIEDFVKSGFASSKADLARKALKHYAEELAIRALLQAEQEVADGKILRGDLDTLAKAI